MYLLRRATLRTISSQPSSHAIKQRTFVTSRSTTIKFTSQWQQSLQQRRFASDEASPTEAQTSGETVTTEPSEAEQKESVVEESIATSDVADGRSATQQATAAASSAAGSVKDAAMSGLRQASRATGFEYRDSRAPRGDYQEAQPSPILYVGNLFFEATAEALEKEFSQFGTIVNSKVATDPRGLSKGFGYVEFESADAAGKAIQGLDQQVFQGRRLAVQYHVRRQSRGSLDKPETNNPPSKTLFIGNMSFQMSDKDLNDLFREVRNVLDVRVAIDRRSGQPRGFAHADFIDTASAEKAKKLLEGKNVYGRTLRVDFGRSSTSTRQDRPDRQDRQDRQDRE